MADQPDNQSQPYFHTPLGLIVAGTILAILSTIAWALLIKIIRGGDMASYWNLSDAEAFTVWALVAIPVSVCTILSATYFMIGVIRWAVYGKSGAPANHVEEQAKETVELLRSINDRLLVSETTKRIAYREQDLEALRKAIRTDIEKHDFEAGMVLVTQLSQVYGYRQEAEDFREQIMRARDAETAHQIEEAVKRFEVLLSQHEWEKAAAEAARIQRLYPDATAVRDLGKRVREAREQHKHELERQFLQAAEKDDVELAIELLKEMDKYLTEAEAEPFRETARGVIGKKRQNLGVQFKLAVHDREWTQAVRVGEQIIREFPNSKMADEVRRMLDLLRERAAGEQAARPREMA